MQQDSKTMNNAPETSAAVNNRRQANGASILGKLFRQKSLAEARSLETPLKRCLTVWQLIFYGIAHMAGAGIYVLTGTVIKNKAGPAASLSFLFCAVLSLFTGLCYVEFSTLIPRAGSCYTFTYITLGELPAFLVGWTMISDLVIGMASVAKAFSSTLNAISHQAISNATQAHLGTLPSSNYMDSNVDIVAFLLILILMLLTLTGAAISMSVNMVLSAVQCACLTVMGVACFALGSTESWSQANDGFFPYGLPGVVNGATVAIFAYSGFEAIANAAEECRDPRRSLPTALMVSLGVITLLYFGSCLGLSYLTPYTQLDLGSPFVVAFQSMGQTWLSFVAAGGTLLATGATKLATIYVMPRLFYALAADGVIFPCFAYVQPKLGVPIAGLLFGGLLSALLAMFFNIHTLASFVSMGVLLSYLMIGVDLFYLRYLFRDRIDGEVFPVTADTEFCQLRAWANRLGPGLTSWLSQRSTLRALFLAYLVVSLALGLVVNYVTPILLAWSWLATILPCAIHLVLLAALCTYEPRRMANVYQAPLMPLPPLLAFVINAVLIVRLEWLTWVRFLAWSVVGLIMYIGYGYRHSTSNSDQVYIPLSGPTGVAQDGETESLCSEDTAPLMTMELRAVASAPLRDSANGNRSLT